MIIRILVLILLAPILIILIAVFINFIPLPHFLDDSRQTIAAILAGAISFIYLVGIAIYIIYSFRRLGGIFDKTAKEMGLIKQDFMHFGKRYKGEWHDRELVIEYFPPRVIQGALLNIYLSCDLKITAAISKKPPLLNNNSGRDAVIVLDHGFNVYSLEAGGMNQVFSDSVFSNAINNIIQKGKRGHTLQVYIREKDIWLRSRLANLGPADLKIFINNLEVMAGIMENK